MLHTNKFSLKGRIYAAHKALPMTDPELNSTFLTARVATERNR